MPEEKVEKIKINLSEEEIRKNLEKYKKLAIESGAVNSRIIKTNQITVDERVKLKCEIPKCLFFGTCAHCPPHSMSADRTQKVISLYKNAVVFKIETPAEVIVRDDANQDFTLKLVMAYRKITEICNKLESTAFYDGHYLAVSFAAGSCRHFYCFSAEKCAVLEGKSCLNYYRTRPSMESVGIDCFKLATELGWDIIPVGNGVKSEYISHGTLMGLVLVN